MIKEDIVSLLENSFNNLGVEFERIDKTDCAYLVKVAANDLFKNIGTISFLYFWDEEENCLILYVGNIYKFSGDNELLKIYEIVNDLNTIVDFGSFQISKSSTKNKKQITYRICLSTNTKIYKLDENTIKAQIDTALQSLNYGLRYMKIKGLIGNEK
jgi:hypothetical protein